MYHGLGYLFIKLTRNLPATGTVSLSLDSSVFHTVVYKQVTWRASLTQWDQGRAWESAFLASSQLSPVISPHGSCQGLIHTERALNPLVIAQVNITSYFVFPSCAFLLFPFAKGKQKLWFCWCCPVPIKTNMAIQISSTWECSHKGDSLHSFPICHFNHQRHAN